MLVTNQTNQDFWFGPLHLDAGIGTTLTVDDTSDTSLYLTDDTVADAINNLYLADKITVTGAADPFPRPTGTPTLIHGDGVPEGIVYAPQGSVYMRRDGSDANGGLLYLKSTGITINTGWLDLATASGAEAAIPTGTLTAFAGATAPSGWLVCDGSAISRSTYSDLFTVVGTTYGAGDGSTTFNLPDLRGRVVVGYAASGGHPDVSTLGNNDGVAEQYRRPKHQHTPHSHTYPVASAGGGSWNNLYVGNNGHPPAGSSSTDGGSGIATDSLDAPAWLVVNQIIKT
jgi:microcystin-dependent protein